MYLNDHRVLGYVYSTKFIKQRVEIVDFCHILKKSNVEPFDLEVFLVVLIYSWRNLLRSLRITLAK